MEEFDKLKDEDDSEEYTREGLRCDAAKKIIGIININLNYSYNSFKDVIEKQGLNDDFNQQLDFSKLLVTKGLIGNTKKIHNDVLRILRQKHNLEFEPYSPDQEELPMFEWVVREDSKVYKTKQNFNAFKANIEHAEIWHECISITFEGRELEQINCVIEHAMGINVPERRIYHLPENYDLQQFKHKINDTFRKLGWVDLVKENIGKSNCEVHLGTLGKINN